MAEAARRAQSQQDYGAAAALFEVAYWRSGRLSAHLAAIGDVRLELRNRKLAENVYNWLLAPSKTRGGGGGDAPRSPRSPRGERRSSVERSDATIADHAREKLKLIDALSAAGASGRDGGRAAMV